MRLGRAAVTRRETSVKTYPLVLFCPAVIEKSRVFAREAGYTAAVMCGRFYLTATPAEIRKVFKLEKVPELVPRYNIAPMQSAPIVVAEEAGRAVLMADRKSTRLNSSHRCISYAVFCLKKKK